MVLYLIKKSRTKISATIFSRNCSTQDYEFDGKIKSCKSISDWQSLLMEIKDLKDFQEFDRQALMFIEARKDITSLLSREKLLLLINSTLNQLISLKKEYSKESRLTGSNGVAFERIQELLKIEMEATELINSFNGNNKNYKRN
jgi:hypothetical protein